jgi:hypothetical protein
MRITICGAGNAAQTLIALLAGDGQHSVSVYAPLAGEAERLATTAGVHGVEASFAGGPTFCGLPALVTDDPGAAVADADLVLMALPAFAHEVVLRTLAPRLPGKVWIGVLPARGGFDWMAQEVLAPFKRTGHNDLLLFGLQTLPWACRIHEWGRRVDVLGVKAGVDLAAWPSPKAPEVAATLAGLIQVDLQPVPTFLALTLANTGQIIHPGIMYALFHNWDGVPFAVEQTPSFYGGIDPCGAEILQAMSAEVQHLCRELESIVPALDLSCVLPVHEWLLRCYTGQIEDPRTLCSAFNTNRAYLGLQAPVTPVTATTCVPAFTSRYLSEDIPHGLLVTRGIAELAGVPTPTIDRVILWAQQHLGRHYLTDGKINSAHLTHSRAPQRYGIDTVSDLLSGG